MALAPGAVELPAAHVSVRVLDGKAAEGQQRGVLVVESVWPHAAFEGGMGINALMQLGTMGAHDTANVMAGGQRFST